MKLPVAIVVDTDPNFPGGADNVTRDANTGLEWLDWTASTNISLDEMIGQFRQGGVFEGWRHASLEEVDTFFANFGLSEIRSRLVLDDSGAAAIAAMSLLGMTYPAETSSVALAAPIHQPDVVEGGYLTARVQADRAKGSLTRSSAGFPVSFPTAGNPLSPLLGHALVRNVSVTAVPETRTRSCAGGDEF